MVLVFLADNLMLATNNITYPDSDGEMFRYFKAAAKNNQLQERNNQLQAEHDRLQAENAKLLQKLQELGIDPQSL
jgi:hypothetical protein